MIMNAIRAKAVVADYLKNYANGMIVWECNKCGNYLRTITEDSKCAECGTDMRSESTKRRMYSLKDIEHAIDKVIGGI